MLPDIVFERLEIPTKQLDIFPSLSLNQTYGTISPNNMYEEITDMSIIMGLIGTDGIILATDSRTTWQKSGLTYHNDNAKKLHKLVLHPC